MADNPEESAPQAAPAADALAAMKKSMDEAHRAAIEAEKAVAGASAGVASPQTAEQQETEGN